MNQTENAQNNQLRQYTVARQRLGNLLRAALHVFEDSKAQASMEQCQSLLVKLAEDRFNLAVVGQFKRGKSSLMNAVIGRELLPTGLLPLTSAITTLRYGPQERVILKRKDWTLTQEIPIADLAAFVTEQGNPGNQKGLLEACVEIPVPFLRRGIHFIDTPGIGSSRQENTATTYAFLPEADAVIFVTSVEAPISEAEERFLRDVRQYAHKLFVVVNKTDLLAQAEHDQVVDYIRVGIAPIVNAPNARIYSLSAHQGLIAKLNNDAQGIQQSGLQEFEAAIAAFLAEEKSRVFLMAILDRALRLLADFESSAGEGSPAHALQAALQKLRPVIQSPDENVPDETGDDALVVQAPLEKAMEANQIKRETGADPSLIMSRTCPICAAQSQAVFDFFTDWQYAIGRDEDARRAFRAARGFCWLHTWQFQQIAAPQGISEGYAPLVEGAVLELRQWIGRTPQESAAALERLLPTGESCPACRLLRQTAAAQVAQFITLITTPESQERYRHSLGLCLPHLQAVLHALPSPAIADFLLNEQANRLEEISEDMHSFVLKRTALRRGLLNTDERQAWLRALRQLSGEHTARSLK